jgi:hypothetical protein
MSKTTHASPVSALRNFGSLLVLICLSACGPARSQTLAVNNGSGQAVNQGDTLSINTIPNMPGLTLSVNGGTSCDTFSYEIDVSYTDQAQFLTEVTYGASNIEGDLSSTVDWFGVLQGGSATITWTFNGVQQASFGFFINGINPPNSAVDAYLASGNAPWFAQNLTAWESGAYNYAPYNRYHQFDSNGYPLWGTPDGIGLMQLEQPARFSGGQDFWAWSLNIADGLTWLNGKKTTFDPYGNWTAELGDMTQNTANTGSNPVPANWPSDCTNHANGAVCGGFNLPSPTFDCSFSSSNANGSPNGFGDGNWIHLYNGSYFVDWVDAVPPAPGYWEYDRQEPNNGYVYDVCTSPPL